MSYYLPFRNDIREYMTHTPTKREEELLYEILAGYGSPIAQKIDFYYNIHKSLFRQAVIFVGYYRYVIEHPNQFGGDIHIGIKSALVQLYKIFNKYSLMNNPNHKRYKAGRFYYSKYLESVIEKAITEFKPYVDKYINSCNERKRVIAERAKDRTDVYGVQKMNIDKIIYDYENDGFNTEGGYYGYVE